MKKRKVYSAALLMEISYFLFIDNDIIRALKAIRFARQDPAAAAAAETGKKRERKRRIIRLRLTTYVYV